MDNIVGYICSTPWGTVSRTTPSLGWTPVLPAIPDGWQDAGTGAAPTGFRIIVRPGTRFPTLFPKMPRADLAAVHAPDTEPGRWSLCWDHTSQSWEMRRGVTAEAAFIRSCSTPGLAWEALADYCLEHSDELDELARTSTAWAGYPIDWAAASDELMDELLGVLL